MGRWRLLILLPVLSLYLVVVSLPLRSGQYIAHRTTFDTSRNLFNLILKRLFFLFVFSSSAPLSLQICMKILDHVPELLGHFTLKCLLS